MEDNSNPNIHNGFHQNRITDLEIKKNKCRIEIDGIYHLFLYTSQLKKSQFKQMIQIGRLLTVEDIELLDQEVINRGKRRIMYLLARQDYPKVQLEKKLLTDGYNQNHVDLILTAFVDRGYVDDERLAIQKIGQYKQYKSKREIAYVLKNKGFDSDIIKEGIKSELDDQTEYESALRCVKKKFDSKRDKMETKELRNKIYGFLGRKGYSSRSCQNVLKTYFESISTEDEDNYINDRGYSDEVIDEAFEEEIGEE